MNSFKFANFALDEEKDLANLDTTNLIDRLASNDEKIASVSWDSIIPKEELDRLAEEKRLKLEAELNLGPRQRVKLNNTYNDGDKETKKEKKKRRKRKNASDDSDNDEDSPPAKKKRGRRSKVDASNEESPSNGTSKEKKRRVKKKKEARDDEVTPKQKKHSKHNSENGLPNEKKKNGNSEKKLHKSSSSKLKHASRSSSSKKDAPGTSKPVIPDKLRRARGIKFDMEKYRGLVMDKNSPYFGKVVEAFRPASHYLKRLIGKDDSHDVDRALQKIGNFIIDYVSNTER